MSIVDPFETPSPDKAEGKKGEIVDPFETGHAVSAADAAAEHRKSLTAGYWKTQEQMARDAYEYMKSGIHDIGQTEVTSRSGIPELAFAAGKTGLGALAYLMSPVSSAYRVALGNPVEYFTGIPREQTEFAAQLATPLLGLGRAPEINVPGYRPAPPVPPGFAAKLPPMPTEIAAAAERQGIAVPRAIGSESGVTQAAGQGIGAYPIVGRPVRKAVEAVPEQLGQRARQIAAEHGEAGPEVTGGQISESLGTAAEREATVEQQRAAEANIYNRQRVEEANAAQQRAQEEAQRVREQTHQADIEARQQAVRDRLDQSHEQLDETLGNVDPNEMGEDTVRAVRSAHATGRGAEQAAWNQVHNLNGGMENEAFHNIRQTAEDALRASGHTVDDPGSNAGRMLSELDRLSGKPAQPAEIPKGVNPRVLSALQKTYGDNIPPEAWKSVGVEPPTPATEAVPPDFRLAGTYAPEPGAGSIPIQGVEQIRRRISDMAFNAPRDDAADRAASNVIKKAVDDWFANAAENHLTPGSDASALETIRNARATTNAFRNRFGYNAHAFPAGDRRDAARMLNDIVTGDMGREDVARNLVGAKPGQRGISAPFYDAVAGAVDNPDAFRNSVRGVYRNAVAGEGRANSAVARDVSGLRTTRMGERLFEPAEHDLMQAHSDLASRTPNELRDIARTPAPEAPPKPSPLAKPAEFKIEPGEAQQLAKNVIGARSEEQVFDKFDRMGREGGDFQRANQTWNAMSDEAKNNYRGQFIRNLGGGEETFSPAKFVSNWNDYSDRFKAMVLNDPDHVQALEDIYTISKRYTDVMKKYGNPSGTAQVRNWIDLAKAVKALPATLAAGATFTGGPLGTLASALGSYGLARVLASPIGAQQVSRWTKIAEVASKNPQAMNTLRAQTGNVARIATRQGVAANRTSQLTRTD